MWKIVLPADFSILDLNEGGKYFPIFSAQIRNKDVRVNALDVVHIDSVGFGALVDMQRRATERGLAFEILASKEMARRAKVIGLHRFLNLHELA